MPDIEIVDISSIPRKRPESACNPVVTRVLAEVRNLPPDKTLKVSLQNNKEAVALFSVLRHHRDKSPKLGSPDLSNLRLAKRGNLLFCWLEQIP